MTKKRKFHFIYSNNTDEEEYQIRKDFNEMLRKNIFKSGHTLVEFIMMIFIIIIILAIFNNIYINTIIKTSLIIILTIILFLYINLIYKEWKK